MYTPSSGVRSMLTNASELDQIYLGRMATWPDGTAVRLGVASEKRALRALTFDGQEPTPMNATSGACPHFRRLFLVTRARRSTAVERFVVFVRSAAVRHMLTSKGQWIP